MSRRGPRTTDPRVIIAGTGSGVGKTVISCAIIRGFMRSGYEVQPFKAGPDYIDPGYLAAAAGRRAVNLDEWLMGRRGILQSLARNSSGMAAIIEGVMGYYDGFDGRSGVASTHRVATMTHTPTILVVDAGGGARSVAATILGFLRFARNAMVHGVILNRVGSRRHALICQDALEPLGVRVMGAVPRHDVTFDSRHLGLVPPAEDPSIQSDIDAATGHVLDHIDMDAVLDVAMQAGPLPACVEQPHTTMRARLGVALDGSFNFYYTESLRRLCAAGAELSFFSPESDDLIPEVDGLYIGGGFPEVRAPLLEKNQTLMRALADMVSDSMPVYAECGGLMYLCRRISQKGHTHRMAAVFDMDTEMTGSLTLNYTSGSATRSPIFRKATRFRGHEFHYSAATDISQDAVFSQRLDIGRGIQQNMDGIISHGAMASYGHLYLSETAAETLVANCARYSRG